MKKLIALTLITLLLAGGCAAPAAQNATSAPVTGSTAAADVTLKFVRIGNDAPEAAYWKAVISRFETANPGIHIEYDDAAIGEPMETKLNAAFAAGMGPDIIGHGIMSVAARAEAKQYQPVTKYFSAWEGKDDLMPSVLANGTYQKEVYGLGYSTTPYVFAWRKDLFQAAGLDPETPPKTWADLKSMAEKLTVKDAQTITQSGFAFPKSAGNFVEYDCFVFGNGGRYYDDSGKPTLDTPDKAEAFQFLSSFVGDVSIPFSNTEVNPFVAGKAAMTLINNVALTAMLKNDAYKDKIGIALPPANEGHEQATFCGCNMLFIGGTCKHPDEAFRFISFALTKDEVLQRAKELNIPVTRKSQVEAFAALNPMNAVRAACVEHGIGMPRTTWAATFQKIRNDMVQQVLYSKASPQDALKAAQAKLLEEIK
jgi:ABC-type glycerol-3-phosphate transport system substrate-binding protein